MFGFTDRQGHPTDRFGKLSVRKAFNPFLKRIVTSNLRDMRYLMPVVFVLLIMSFWEPKKGQLSFS